MGIVTEAILKLIPMPETTKTMLALYQDLDAAAQSVAKIISNKIIPVTLEFLDRPTLIVVEDFAKIGLPTNVEAVLLIEQDGPPEVVERDMKRMADICLEEKAVSVEIAETESDAAALKTARRTALSALARLKPTTILKMPPFHARKLPKWLKRLMRSLSSITWTFALSAMLGMGTCIQRALPTLVIMRKWREWSSLLPTFLPRLSTLAGRLPVNMV